MLLYQLIDRFMLYDLKMQIKKMFPRSFVLWTHKTRGVAAAFYYGFPAGKLRVIGVAGTKGTTILQTWSLNFWKNPGHKVAMFSTANMRLDGKESPNTEKLTTPSPFFLQKFLSDAVGKGCDYAVIEVSSHALIQSRLYGINFHKAVITNLMPDHLDYHKDSDEYRDVHLQMIGPKTEEIMINGEDEQAQRLIRQWADSPKDQEAKIMNFGLRNSDDLQASDIELNSGVKFNVKFQGKDLGGFILNIPGKFSVYNALGSISLGLSEGIEPDKIRKALISVIGIFGRLESIKVSEAQDFSVIVDYAHSPNSLKAVYEAIKPSVKAA